MEPFAWNVPSSTIACEAGTFTARSNSTWYVAAGEKPSRRASSGRGSGTGAPDGCLVVPHVRGDRIIRNIHTRKFGVPPRDVHHQPLVQDADARVAHVTTQRVIPEPRGSREPVRP